MIKKWGSMFIIAMLIWSQLELISTKAASDGFTTILNADDTLTITGWEGVFPTEGLEIPSTLTYGGVEKTVTIIGEQAFLLKEVKSVTIPSTVKKIGKHAFSSSKLTELNFEQNSELEEIANTAFMNNELVTLTIPSSVQKIGNHAFANNKVTSVNFEASSNLLEIGNEAFVNYLMENGNQITNITIPKSVKNIGNFAFSGNKLMTLMFEQGSQLENIGSGAFGHNQLESISLPSSLEAISNNAFQFNILKKIEFAEPATPPITVGPAAFKFQSGIVETLWYLNGNESTPWDQEIVTTAFTAYAEPQALPPAPTSIMAVAGDSMATVSFTSTTDSASVVTGDSASVITGYKVKVYVNGQEQSTLRATGTQSPIIVTGLTNGTTYTFKVVATSGLIDSLDSEISNAVTPTAPATVPSAPTIHSVSPLFGSAIVNFYPATSNGGSVITGYKVKVYEAGVEKPALETPTTETIPNIVNLLTVVVPNLTIGQSYTFKVVATNDVGDSEESAESNPPIIPTAPIIIPTIPSAPTNITALAGNGQASVSFVAPISIGSPILGYKVKVLEAGVENPALQTIGTMSPIIVTGLTNGITYTFKVVASNSVGDSVDSLESNAVTPGVDTYMVTFQTNGGSYIAPEFIAHGEGITAPPAPTRSGYTFAGWYKDSTLQTAWNFATDKVTENTTLYAKWTAMPTTNPPVVTSPSGSNSTPSTTTEIRVDVVDASNPDAVLVQTVITRETSNGIVKDTVNFTAANAREAIEKLMNQQNKKSRIIIPDEQQQVSETTIGIAKEAAQILVQNQTSMGIDMETVKFDIPATSFANINSDIYFRVVPVKAQATKQQLEQRAKTEEIVKQLTSTTVTLLGQPMTIETNMQNRPVTLTLPLPNDVTQEQLDSLAVYIEHSDGTKEVVRGQIVDFKTGIKGIQFDVTKFSTFTILYAPVEKEETVVENPVSIPYIQGYADGTFRPNASVTRAQMASMLARHLTNNEIPTASPSFKDTAKHGAKDAIEYVKAQGLFQGTTATTFQPNGTITRAQMAAVVVRWMEQQGAELTFDTKSTFTDVKANHWAAEAIAKVHALGIMTGTSQTTFNPEGALTRAQAVKVLNQLFELEVQASERAPLFKDVTSAHWAFDDIQAAAQ